MRQLDICKGKQLFGRYTGCLLYTSSELVKELEEKFGVSAAAPVAVAAAPAAGGAAAEAAEETVSYTHLLRRRAAPPR